MEFLNKILESRDHVLGEIYIIRNQANGKCYVGQTVTHRKNHNKYRPFGYLGRFRDHVSEALCNTKKKQCSLLNNAIRKHGKEGFIVELITRCSLSEIDEMEKHMITVHGTLYPNGYNLTEGGKGALPKVSYTVDHVEHVQRTKISRSKSDATKALIAKRLQEHIHDNPTAIKRLSSNAKQQHLSNKMEKFKDVREMINKEDPYSHITCKSGRYWVTIHGVKTSFVGKFSSDNDLRQDAVNFINSLLSLAT